MKLEALLDKNGQYTELFRIIDFTSIEECLQRINEHFISPYELATAEPSDLFYADVEFCEGKNYKYCYVAGDGQVAFVEDLSEFSEGYNTEEEWKVTDSVLLK